MPTVFSFGADLLACMRVLTQVERVRRGSGPGPAVMLARRIGSARSKRTLAERNRLRRAIRWVDRLVPTGPNCYRRVLMEIALDRGAAAEPLMMGFRAGGEPSSGHAWLGTGAEQDGNYDAVVSV